jgi:hypothetical protein
MSPNFGISLGIMKSGQPPGYIPNIELTAAALDAAPAPVPVGSSFWKTPVKSEGP